ncbi:uncharacterized protein LOC126847028 [Adelges cooleyi]|uniref:uncharacterized protein LOC126847028 n=1 Tax=Adelges cooleyi TaxID=133065 RepID=UPI00217FA557|nr:uncharacterized protein LOC126847028 [Adelges cooleyi]
MATIRFYFVLSICVLAFANDVFQEKDLVHFRDPRDNSTDYYMFVTQDGVNPESNPNSSVIEILKPRTTDYNKIYDMILTVELSPKYKGRYIVGVVGDEMLPLPMD